MGIFGHRVYSRVASSGVITSVYDEFYEPTSTLENIVLLTDHTPNIDVVGGGWVRVPGDLNLACLVNRATTANANGTWHHAQIDVGASDYKIESDFYISDGSIENIENARTPPYAAVMVCFQDLDNFVVCGVQYEPELPERNRAVIWERVAGAYLLRGESLWPVGAGSYPTTGTIEVTKIGASIDFTLVVHGTSYNIPYSGVLNSESTKSGIAIKSSRAMAGYCAIDNFFVGA